jgi:hypothetical protein
MDELIALNAAQRGLPGCRRLYGVSLLTVRHFDGDGSAREAANSCGLEWPAGPGCFSGADGPGPWLAWRTPYETLAIAPLTVAAPASATTTRAATNSALLQSLLAALAPGNSPTALAADLSESLAWYALHGPRLDDWLAHLVDAGAIPRTAGRCTRARLVDVPAWLMRLTPESLWLATDAPAAAYTDDWLRFTHAGAFSAPG